MVDPKDCFEDADYLVEQGFYMDNRGKMVYINFNSDNLQWSVWSVESAEGIRKLDPREFRDNPKINPESYISIAEENIKFVKSKLEQLTRSEKLDKSFARIVEAVMDDSPQKPLLSS